MNVHRSQIQALIVLHDVHVAGVHAHRTFRARRLMIQADVHLSGDGEVLLHVHHGAPRHGVHHASVTLRDACARSNGLHDDGSESSRHEVSPRRDICVKIEKENVQIHSVWISDNSQQELNRILDGLTELEREKEELKFNKVSR